jgi:hypothetical protein
VDLALLIGSGGLDKLRIMEPLRLTFEREEHTICRPTWFHRQQIGRSRFKHWRRNAGSQQMSLGCLRVFRSTSTKCWHNAQSGERGMTENGSDSLPFEPPEQENVRLREENARLRRLLAVHSIPIPQLPAENPPPTKTVGPAPPVDKEERARQRIALFRSLFRGRAEMLRDRLTRDAGTESWNEPEKSPSGDLKGQSRNRSRGTNAIAWIARCRTIRPSYH